MIIKDDDKSLPLRPEPNVDVLPPYSPSLPPRSDDSSATLASSSSASLPSPSSTSSSVPSIPRSNFLCIQRNNTSLKGTYVIDPTLDVPEAVLPQLEPGQERKNLLLECQNGGINAEVYLVGTGVGSSSGDTADESGMSKKRPTTVDVTGRNGFIAVKLNVEKEHPFALRISAHNGGISLYLPNSFCGPLTTRTENGWVGFSASLAPNVTTFSDVKSTRKCFVGDFSSSNYGRGEWEGSSIDLDCHNGRVKLCYVDEDDQANARSGGNFLTRVLGLKF